MDNSHPTTTTPLPSDRAPAPDAGRVSGAYTTPPTPPPTNVPPASLVTPEPAADRAPSMQQAAAAVDEARAVESRKRKRPSSYILFDDGQGDFRVYEINQDPNLPRGALIPIPGVPGFPDTPSAKKGLRHYQKLLVGKQVMILRGIEIIRVEVNTEPTIKLTSKPRAKIEGGGA